uniref:Uncharacterized protein n=1 Tax=Anguilla anguilla TaxID=7936 RepID=A0A0E9RBN5_ANGAN
MSSSRHNLANDLQPQTYSCVNPTASLGCRLPQFSEKLVASCFFSHHRSQLSSHREKSDEDLAFAALACTKSLSSDERRPLTVGNPQHPGRCSRPVSTGMVRI